MSLRTLDAIQLAIALDFLADGLVAWIVSADRRLREVAEISGCPSIDPCNPGRFIP